MNMAIIARCRLCLEHISEDNSVDIGDSERNMLETVAPLIKLDMTSEPKLCDKCVKLLQISYGFKLFWIQNNESVKKLLILRELYPEPSLASCGICGQTICDGTVDGEETNWKEMVEKCVPELDVCFGDKVSACSRCVEDLRSVYTFINDITDLERKIVDYSSSKDKYVVDLDDVSTFFNVSIGTGYVKERNEFKGTVNEVTRPIKEEKVIQINENLTEGVAEGHKITINQNIDVSLKTSSSVSEESATLEASSIRVTHKSVERNPTRHKKRTNGPSSQYQCDQCSYASKYKSALKSHLMRHKDPSETTMFKCPECGHETKRKADLQAHLIVHKDYHELLKTFKCALCPYQAKRKCDLKQHSFSHQPKIFKCDHCPYVTNNPGYLNKIHVLKHKDKSEIHTYKCTECTYESYNRVLLKKHAMVHRSSSEIPIYKCNWCDVETRTKVGIRQHMDVHMCPSEAPTYDCYHCGYKSRRKSYLKNHMKTHTNYAGGETYYCANCIFETKRKRSLVQHMQLHKNAFSSDWYRCELCEYKSARKGNFAAHMLTHKKKLEDPRVIDCFKSMLGVLRLGEEIK